MFSARSIKGSAAAALMGVVFLAAPARSQDLVRRAQPAHLTLKSSDKREDTLQRVRGQVLALLQQDNGCSAWFHEAENDPAGVFQSLQFEIDKEKQAYVFRIANDRQGDRYKHPWAARALQWGGRNSTVHLNPEGPFFNSSLPIMQLSSSGAFIRPDGFRVLTVGPYRGNTGEARITTLLHELGHVTARIPEDNDSWDGKSSRNTEEVLRHCRTEIQEYAKWSGAGGNG
jgi:hypothetical protein